MTRVAAWVRALNRGRRRVLVRAARPAMVLAPRPVAPPVATRVFNRFSAAHLDHYAHRHEHRHITLARPQAAPATTGQPPALRRDLTTHVLRSHTVERAAGAAGGRGPTGPALVLAPARMPRAASAPLPEAAAAARALVEQMSGSHRRVESPAPRLRARPVSAGEEKHGLPPAAAPAPAPAMVLSRQTAALAHAAAQAAVAAATGPPGRELVSPRHTSSAPVLDVESLTDRVVDQIDRRVNAQRERFGKF